MRELQLSMAERLRILVTPISAPTMSADSPDKSPAFGDRVRERREAEGLSQEELAQEVGLSRNYLSQIERGRATNLSFEVVRRISERLGLPVHEGAGPGSVPESLRRFADEAGLPPADVAMLARIEYRGRRPETPEQWRVLYSTIKAMTGNA